MRRSLWILALVAAASGGFVIGRWSDRTKTPRSHVDRSGSERAHAPSAPESGGTLLPPRAGSAPGSASVAGSETQRADRTAVGATSTPATLAACTDRLESLHQAATAAEEDRIAREGAPIPPPTDDLAPRFRAGALASAVKGALAQAKLPGGVDGTDCTEYPCIVYGRINGTEDDVEALEQARAFDVYDDDISNILLWVQTDEAAEEAAERRGRRDEHAEQMLFAIAFYSHQDASTRGDDLDRRIRWRVTDLWNARNPSDESGPSRPG